MRDEVFTKPITKQFEFDENVASVFDDMINRSVPYYQISSDLIAKFLLLSVPKDARILDLGCSTAAMLLKLFELNPKFTLTGVDNSPSMLENAKSKAAAYGANLNLINSDILEFELGLNDAIIMNYTLQFIRPLKREKFIAKIYDNLVENGVFVLSEKVIFEDKKMSKDMIEIYAQYKLEQGYSKFEIAQKREALENVLIPFSEYENIDMLKKAGFRVVETLFKWGNFASFVAIK
ncbi:carboxy-S-adenosyl-L-methionine synthase CmoA [Campylobacter corcagiensis]|uniref:Carboxy-S-adenosyl-L-methionine synthase n=1 Tax=Campylobacter corcagiensis TaxID=1448857 RepID=A0A7M1LEF4_9BACT|nr:carboxy-S-adenosyl-L-methionine synthase CmoA [Campylobacter corcagiensis]QKF64883.1 carboxy-S-adenosyl-L-methionine synthase [Campylobacter corcagiensis]QOQ86957.1 carboxy-S-adenosyl-L-methionine synthase CmoA [Campylobacter corcagiensis]